MKENTNNTFSTTIAPAGGSNTPLTIQVNGANGASHTQRNHILNTQPFVYDANSNQLADNTYTYTYDAADRLVGIHTINPQPPTVTDNIQMTYDGKGRRVSITELHGSTVLTAKIFVLCKNDVCEERDSTDLGL